MCYPPIVYDATKDLTDALSVEGAKISDKRFCQRPCLASVQENTEHVCMICRTFCSVRERRIREDCVFESCKRGCSCSDSCANVVRIRQGRVNGGAEVPESKCEMYETIRYGVIGGGRRCGRGSRGSAGRRRKVHCLCLAVNFVATDMHDKSKISERIEDDGGVLDEILSRSE